MQISTENIRRFIIISSYSWIPMEKFHWWNSTVFQMEHLELFRIFSRLRRFLDFVGFGRNHSYSDLRFLIQNHRTSLFKWVERNQRPIRNHFSSLFFDQFSHFWQLTIIFSVKLWLKPRPFSNQKCTISPLRCSFS